MGFLNKPKFGPQLHFLLTCYKSNPQSKGNSVTVPSVINDKGKSGQTRYMMIMYLETLASTY